MEHTFRNGLFHLCSYVARCRKLWTGNTSSPCGALIAPSVTTIVQVKNTLKNQFFADSIHTVALQRVRISFWACPACLESIHKVSWIGPIGKYEVLIVFHFAIFRQVPSSTKLLIQKRLCAHNRHRCRYRQHTFQLRYVHVTQSGNRKRKTYYAKSALFLCWFCNKPCKNSRRSIRQTLALTELY